MAFSAWLEPLKLPAALTMPANEGAETLVPPTTNQPVPRTGLLSQTQTPVAGLASKERSGVPRELPTIARTPSWNEGRGSIRLEPPPASCQVFSRMKSPVFGLREILVPPAETTFGETLGYSVPGLSPEEAKKTTPGKTKSGSKTVSGKGLFWSDGPNSPVPKQIGRAHV